MALGPMSAYTLAKICQLVRKDETFAQRLKEDPDAVLGDFPLTDEERAALLAGDVAWLYDRGVHGLLLGYLAGPGVFGITMPLYLERIRAARLPPEDDRTE
jgi:hypothetical protein